ncbi:MAG TPA: patatin-like phospholipase family protein [Daejeonella sp.]
MKVGLVLSGGGIRGIAHLGVLQALTEAGIKFCKVSGTSAGSIVGSLYCQGMEPYDILQTFIKTKLYRFLRPAFKTPGLLSLDLTRSLFLKYLPHDSFEGLKTPMVIAVTNFSEGKLVYLSSGKLIEAILASSSIPGVFKPIIINNKMYLDGGVLNNFPIEPVRQDCDFIIGSSCNHLPVVDKIVNTRKLIERAAIMSINADMEQKSQLVDVLIEPEGMGATSVFDVKKTEEIYWLSYNAALNQLKSNAKLQSLLVKS